MEDKLPTLLTIEYVVIVIYLVALAGVGPIVKSFNRNSDDYFRGGARTKWWLLGPSLAMSIISAAAFTGVAGAIYEAGIAPLATNLGQWTAGIVLVGFLAAWLRQLRKVTGAEVVRERFGVPTEQFFSYLNMCMMPIYGAFQLLGLSIFVSAVFKIPLEQTIIGLGIVVGIYSVSGGRWAVMATDFLQNLVLQTVVVAVGVLAFVQLGGISGFIDKVAESGGFQFVHEAGAFPDGQYTGTWIIAVFCIMFIGQLQLGWSARFFAAKDGREAQKATALMFLILIGSTIFFVAPPLAARVLYPDQVMAFTGILNKPEESAYVVACLNLLPTGMMGLVLVAMFSATAAAMDSGLNSNAAVIVRNVMPPLRRKFGMIGLDPLTELKWGRRVTTILAAVILLTTLALARLGSMGIFELMMNFAARVQLPLTIPFVLAIFLRKAPRSSAMFSIISGFVGPLVVFFLLNTQGVALEFSGRLVVVASFSVIGFFASYRFWSDSDPDAIAQTRNFYYDMLRPVDFEKEVGHANDRQQLFLLGRLSAGLGAMLMLLLLIPNSLQDRLTILAMAGGILVVGLLMLLGSRQPKN